MSEAERKYLEAHNKMKTGIAELFETGTQIGLDLSEVTDEITEAICEGVKEFKSVKIICSGQKPGKYESDDMGTNSKIPVTDQLYEYCWVNNEARKKLKGRKCRVIYRGRMNSCLIEMVDTCERNCVSRNSLRKVK